MSANPGDQGPRIIRVELTPIHVPFREEVRQAMQAGEGGLGMAIPAEEAWLGGDFVICRLLCDDGSSGLGEVFVWLPETGVSPEHVISTIRDALGRYVLGESPFAVERMTRRMDSNVARSGVAIGLLDMACYDLMGRITGRPASDLMGGRHVDALHLCALVPLMDIESMDWLARSYLQGGVRSFRFKLGRGVGEDAAIMGRMRESLGEGARFRVDYNQAYTPAQAVRAIKAIEPFGVEVAEQPVRTGDFQGMARVQRAVDTPLMAHESFFSLQDLVALNRLGAIGVVGVNAERPGGITAALRAIAYAELEGMGVVIHNQSLGIAAAAQIHLAAARYASLGYDPELFGQVMFEDDLIRDPIAYEGGTVRVPDGPGWGVELDEDALDRYAVGERVVLEA
ncbi:MAG: mandelate racemase/muconate lactonizing enzyme family protein [Actinobacteria bacterium]|nr:mandelate racemase/muconate lactonizing enzyme family protein [Actinomycetota bacterium]